MRAVSQWHVVAMYAQSVANALARASENTASHVTFGGSRNVGPARQLGRFELGADMKRHAGPAACQNDPMRNIRGMQSRHSVSCSSSAFASLRTGVSKPSVSQL